MAFTCFVSYARSDVQEDGILTKFVADLRSDLSVAMHVDPKEALFFDTTSLDLGSEWSPRIRDALVSSKVLVSLSSPNYLNSVYCGREYQAFLKRREAAIHKNDGEFAVILPLIWLPADLLPDCISRFHWGYPDMPKVYKDEGLRDMARSQRDKDHYYKFLSVLVKSIKTAAAKNLAALESLPPLQEMVNAFAVPALLPSPDAPSPSSSTRPEDISKLRQKFSSVEVVGREPELRKLKALWKQPKGRVVVIWGPAGAGKTALAWEFLNLLKRSGKMPKAERIYAWTFLNQGQDDFQSTATGFVRGALKHFGQPLDTVRPFSDLARAVLARRCLLILDGIETLQDPQANGGKLAEHNNDQGLASFLKEICKSGMPEGGLILITSKEPVVEVAGHSEPIEVDRLQPEDGATLLRKSGVQGPEKELRQASKELEGNPLLHVILSGFLKTNSLTIRDRARFTLPTKGPEGEWVKNVVAAYATQLESAERSLLRLLGLFGRPMTNQDLNALKSGKPALAVKFLEGDSAALFRRLRNLHLLNGPDRPRLSAEWYTHPVVRQHFAEEFRNQYEEEFREAHGKLFYHYREEKKDGKSASDKTLALFGAVRHGCLANLYSKAYELYRYRIACEFDGNDTEQNALASEALIALSAFFNDSDFLEPVDPLNKYERAWLLARVSYCLHSLGEVERAVGPREKSNQIYREIGESDDAKIYAKVRYEAARDAAYGAEVLSQIQMRLGDLGNAHMTAEEGVGLAEVSEANESKAKTDTAWLKDYPKTPVPGWMRCCSTKAAFGTVLHKQGQIDEAIRYFQSAAVRHDAACPKDSEYHHCPEGLAPIFHSEPGVWWSQLMLDLAATLPDLDALLDMAQRMRNWSEFAREATDPVRGLHSLVYGMVLTELADFERDPATGPSVEKMLPALGFLNDAHFYMDESRKYHFLCDVLLARARAYRLLSKFADARKDVESAMTLSVRYGMRLTQVDAWILRGHLSLDGRPNYREVLRAVAKVDSLIESTLYYAAEPAVRVLEVRQSGLKGEPLHLGRARRSLQKYPIARLKRELKRYEQGEWKA